MRRRTTPRPGATAPHLTTKKLDARHTTTRIVSDRFAKLATTYTGGHTRVYYVGSMVCTDVRGRIFLPANLRDLKPEDEMLALGYTAHEMGHQRCERDLLLARERNERIRASQEIIDLIPEEVRHLAFRRGQRIVLYSEMLDRIDPLTKEVTHGLTRSKAFDAATVLGSDPASLASQLFTMHNAIEDPRQEKVVEANWPGCAEWLAYVREFYLDRWRTIAVERIESGTAKNFVSFSIACSYRCHGIDTSFFGPDLEEVVDQVGDIIATYKHKGDWTTSMGVYDAWNAALAIVARIHLSLAAAPPPEGATCSECGAPEVVLRVTAPGRGVLTCTKCGHSDEVELEEVPDEEEVDAEVPGEGPAPTSGDEDADEDPEETDEDATDGDGEGGDEDEVDEPESGDDGSEDADGPGSCSDSGSESESSDEPGDGGPSRDAEEDDLAGAGEDGGEDGQIDPPMSGGKSTDKGDEDGDPEESEDGEGEVTDESDDEEDDFAIKKGMIVRLPDGRVGRVTKVYPDGTFDVARPKRRSEKLRNLMKRFGIDIDDDSVWEEIKA